MVAPLLYPSDDPHWIKEGRWLFTQQIQFMRGSSSVESLPPETLNEVAFVGRSNVGKSSLINALTNHKSLARVSHTPGRTQELNFFSISTHGILVDLPGYGFAQAPKTKIVAWNQLIHDYLKGRSTLRRVYVLVDSRHGLKKSDEEIFDLLDEYALSFQVILTKTDKVKPEALESLIKETESKIKAYTPAHPKVLATSSVKKEGLESLWAEIAFICLEKG
jgi:GTP-binding protein